MADKISRRCNTVAVHRRVSRRSPWLRRGAHNPEVLEATLDYPLRPAHAPDKRARHGESPRGQAPRLPVSTTRFADTEVVSVASAVSTGVRKSGALACQPERFTRSGDVDESLRDSFAHQKSPISGDVDSGHPSPHSEKPRFKTFNEAFASRSHSNPQLGQECSLTQMGFAVSTPHLAHSFVVPRAFT